MRIEAGVQFLFAKATVCKTFPILFSTGLWAISAIDEYIEIDSELMNCFKGTKLKNDAVTGEGFPVLKPGGNLTTCAGNVRRPETIPRWLCL